MPSENQNSINSSSQLLQKTPTEALPCPRCDSTSTKFCYYNNYNLSQPRHFCKSCRRYWTQGGTLRNVPIGGGTRKNSKRTRTSSSSSSSCSSATSSSSSSTITTHETSLSIPVAPVPALLPVSTNETPTGNFTAMLNLQGQNFLGLNGFPGYGLGLGFEELDLGFGGSRVWDVPGASFGINGHSAVGGSGVGNSSSGVSNGCNTWQMMSGDDHDQGGNTVGDQDCFAWSGLAISTPGKGLK